MAGKYHRDYDHYARQSDGHVLAPGSKLIGAYAEGYQAYRNGLGTDANPHPASDDDESGFQGWLYGYQDGERGEPATHVGGPDAVPPDPEPDPIELAEAIRTHEAMDELAAELGLIVPSDWDARTLGQKRDFIDAIYSPQN
ncbi:hypothetical protein RGQ15_22310 [Paracoccus sp. MBLB3053]|uniref:Uncharacterized protein n=1 Tax=Paracoccus aurantius TaxID=3073814 RepID=A0ABU2HZ09_9RHOB|nr:hypothetical protein [Paracoccus sp. MBLB3053]MDS9470283.1 hypothetical protein [Paracoccus sp. MBLB3053]